VVAPAYDRNAAKTAVQVTVNADLYAKATAAGIDASALTEQALARALAEHDLAALKAEIRQDLVAYNAYVAEHGSPADLVRRHFADGDNAV
jgi:post-segregation antitoxin (ccd killing protein)